MWLSSFGTGYLRKSPFPTTDEASGGMPIFLTSMIPHSAPIPSFRSWKVTVAYGLTMVSVPNPVGTSHEIIFFPEEFRRSM